MFRPTKTNLVKQSLMGQMPMVSQTVRETRVWSVLKGFGDSVFLTLTTPDVVDYVEIRRRWRIFRHDYFRALGTNPRWVMCFEPHPNGHGWHIHIVIESSFLPVSKIRVYSKRAGFGRIHIERVTSDNMCNYVGKYVCKVDRNNRLNGCSRLRLLNVSRGLSRLSDIEIRSVKNEYCRKCLSVDNWASAGFSDLGKWRLAELYLLFGSALLGHEISAWREYRLECLARLGDCSAASELAMYRIEYGRGDKVYASFTT